MSPLQARHRRKETGLSQVRLARLAGVSRYRYILWELGDGELTGHEKSQLADALARRAEEKIRNLSSLSLQAD